MGKQHGWSNLSPWDAEKSSILSYCPTMGNGVGRASQTPDYDKQSQEERESHHPANDDAETRIGTNLGSTIAGTNQTIVTSTELRTWCENNSNRRYLPESLLRKWGITVDPDVGA